MKFDIPAAIYHATNFPMERAKSFAQEFLNNPLILRNNGANLNRSEYGMLLGSKGAADNGDIFRET